MTDIGIFIFGCCVFGVAIAATMVYVIGPSESKFDDAQRQELLREGRELQSPSRNRNEKIAS